MRILQLAALVIGLVLPASTEVSLVLVKQKNGIVDVPTGGNIAVSD